MDDDVRGPAAPGLAPSTPEAMEVRRLVEAGARSPEDLRALAARLRDEKAADDARWRAEVKPALIKSKKKRPSLKDLRDGPAEGGWKGLLAVTLGVLVLVLAAVRGSLWWIALPVVTVLAYGWWQGHQVLRARARER